MPAEPKHAPPYDRLELRVDPVEPIEPPRSGWILVWVLAAALVAVVVLLILAATPRSGSSAAHPVSAQTGAPLVRGPLDPGNGIQEAEPSGGASSLGATTGGAPNTLDPRVGREGDIAHSGSRRPYLAIPLGPGIRIRICGPAACIVATSTDAGPNRKMLLAGRIADLDIGRWERVCGMQARFGLCPGSWTVVTRSTQPEPRMTLPPTDSGVQP